MDGPSQRSRMIVMGTADEPSSIDSALRSLSRFYYVVNIPGPLEVLRSYIKITKPTYEVKENDDGFVSLIAALENFGVIFFPFILLLLTYFNSCDLFSSLIGSRHRVPSR